MLERNVCSFVSGFVPRLLNHAKAVPHKATRPHICFANRGGRVKTCGVPPYGSSLVCTNLLKSANPPAAAHIQERNITKQLVALAASGAVLGPLCDGQHSRFGVLHYTSPSLITVPGIDWDLETCWWVPVLFAAAAVIIGTGHTVLDTVSKHWQLPSDLRSGGLSWTIVTAGIVSFVVQYAASGALEAPLLAQHLVGLPMLDLLLGTTALLQWYSFDRTLQGMFMATITALAGPAIEVFLIAKLDLYSYSHPTAWGIIPTWIPWVYFCGSPAVGNLGRKIKAVLHAKHV